jgi:hypothetical protein
MCFAHPPRMKVIIDRRVKNELEKGDSSPFRGDRTAFYSQTGKLVQLIFLMLAIGFSCSSLVSQTIPASQASDAGQVAVRISVASWGSRLAKPVPETTMILRPLSLPGAPQTITVKAGEVKALTVPPGRYQLTTTTPLQMDGQSYGWDLELPLTQSVNDVELSLSNAVVLNAMPQPANLPSAEVKEIQPVTPAGSSVPADEDTRVQITALLHKWVEAVKARDLDAQMSCYAPQLTTYYLRHNVPRSEIRLDKKRFFQRYPQIREIKISNLKITGSDQPEATFLKTWNFGGIGSDWRGQVTSHLSFTRASGKWVISSESERLVQVTVPFSESEP